MVVALAVCCVVVPIKGQTSGKDSDTHGQPGANAQTPKRKDSPPSAVNIDTVNVDKLNVPQQPDTVGKSDKDDQQPPSYFSRLIAPETLPNTILCVVGLAGVAAAFYTLRAMKEQAGLMERQATVSEGQTDILRLQQRAWLGGGARIVARDADFIKFEVVVKNTGATPALDVEVKPWIMRKNRNYLNPDDFSTENRTQLNPNRIGKESRFSIPPNDTSTTPPFIWDIRCPPDAPEQWVYVGATITYKDIFDRPHQTFISLRVEARLLNWANEGNAMN